jgi:hypothetical protein
MLQFRFPEFTSSRTLSASCTLAFQAISGVQCHIFSYGITNLFGKAGRRAGCGHSAGIAAHTPALLQ